MTPIQRVAVKIHRESAGTQYVYVVVNGVVEMVKAK